MCGILSFVSRADAVRPVIDGLSLLEYRGYDSVGVAYIRKVLGGAGGADTILSQKSLDGAASLGEKLAENADENASNICVGHTRWATHGGVSLENAHPHFSASGKIALVHNGIIENYSALKSEFNFALKTSVDTEIIPNLIDEFGGGGLITATEKTMSVLRGSYAFTFICADEPEAIFCARNGEMPLFIGRAKNGAGHFISSDVLALYGRCDAFFNLPNGAHAKVSADEVSFFKEGARIKLKETALSREQEIISKGKFSTFMEKEIADISAVSKNIYNYYKKNPIAHLTELLRAAPFVHIVGCGTSLHAGEILAIELEKLKVRNKTYIASEVQNARPITEPHDVAIFISQSGETADTLAALKYFKARNVKTIAICNRETSSIARQCDFNLPLLAGAEIAVASTKAFIAQALVGLILAGQKTPKINPENGDIVKKLANKYLNKEKVFIIGKGADFVCAKEIALKIKEITYRHAEGYAAGELKHGTLSLVDDKTLVIALCSDRKNLAKTENAIAEVSARDASVIFVSPFETQIKIDDFVKLENKKTAFLSATVFGMQLALYRSLGFGLNPDRPRNLAKSITVQ
jgi:glucosamine--fructose-6-phosphate aminotransferase (isomerizing)